MKKVLLLMLLLGLSSARPLAAQRAPEGIWQGYDGEWLHVSLQQLLCRLRRRTPEEKFSLAPRAGCALWSAKCICTLWKPISACLL